MKHIYIMPAPFQAFSLTNTSMLTAAAWSGCGGCLSGNLVWCDIAESMVAAADATSSENTVTISPK